MENGVPFISIIVAAYNVEPYLQEAMQSCMEQTYRNIEIIAVDDGSTDASGRILDCCAEKDQRVHIIHHEKNKGSLSARKTGVNAATGDYFLFLDGDDSLERFACENLVSVLPEKRVDVLQFGAALTDLDGVPEDHIHAMSAFLKPYHGEIMQGEGALVKACFSERLFGWNLWGKLWDGRIIKKAYGYIEDRHQTMAEDMLICFLALLFAKSYAAIDSSLYNYRQGTGITAPGQKSLRKIRGYAESYLTIATIERVLKELGKEEYYKKEFLFVKKQLSNDAAWYFLTQIDPRDAGEALACLLKLWPADVILSALAVGCCREHYVTRGDLLKMVRAIFSAR